MYRILITTKVLFIAFILLIIVGCGGGGSSSATLTVKEIALDKIMAYAENGTKSVPTLQDYIDAGVSGVNSENLAELNAVVNELELVDVDTTAELVALTTQLSINIAPTASAEADKTVQVNQSITITGSGTDIDGSIASYEWKKGTTILATTASFSYTPTAVGTETLTLTVTDNDSATATDSMNVVVTADIVSELNFQFHFIDNADNDFNNRGWMSPLSLFQRNIIEAGKIWGAKIDSTETIYVHVIADRFVLRAGGGLTYGRFLGYFNGYELWEPGSLSRILTGANPANPDNSSFDILVSIDPIFFENYYWLDPEPETRTAEVPADKTELIGVILHEIAHGLGMGGERSRSSSESYGLFPRGFVSLFDSLTYFSNDGNPLNINGDPNPMYFIGVKSQVLYGAEVPITNVGPNDNAFSPSNFYHLGICNDLPILTDSLMRGCYSPNGERWEITPIDLAVFSDLGYPIK